MEGAIGLALAAQHALLGRRIQRGKRRIVELSHARLRVAQLFGRALKLRRERERERRVAREGTDLGCITHQSHATVILSG